MNIPSYKILQVLEAYARRIARETTRTETPGRDRARNPPEGRQQELIDRISDRIIRNARALADNRFVRRDPSDRPDPPDRVRETPAPWGSPVPMDEGPGEGREENPLPAPRPSPRSPVFVYDEIGPDGRRFERTLSLDDATLLVQNPEAGETDAPSPDDDAGDS